MYIKIICDFNPFFTSSAIANRYEGLIKGLLSKGVSIHLVVIKGYNSWNEFLHKGFLFESQYLTITYLVTVFNSTLFQRRINHYLLGNVIYNICDLKLKKIFKDKCDYIWLAGGLDLRKLFLKHNRLIDAKVFMEFNEFQKLYSYNHTFKPSKIKQLNVEYDVTLKTIERVSSMAVMTNTLLDYYKNLANQKTRFLHLPMTVDFTRFSNISTMETYRQPYIAFTGTYTNSKDGVDVLIHSFAKIANDFPNLNLYLAGFYHYDMSMQKQLISEYDLEKRITYIGVLKKHLIPSFIQHAELLVLARPDSRQAQGGFPTKLGEYLATGNPVCVTKVGEIPDYLKDNLSAFMAEPGNVDSFADAMRRALFDKDNAKRVGCNGREVAKKNFSVEVQAKRLYEFLSEGIRS